MKLITTMTLLAAALIIGGCGKDDADSSGAAAPAVPSAAAPAATAAAAPAAAAPAAMSADGPTRYIDHAQDEVEFMLKKSLAGWESLREDVSDSEQVAMIEKEIADLKSKLEAL